MANNVIASIKMDFAGSTLYTGMTNLDSKLEALVLMYANTKAPQLESYMNTHRPWTDRTGMAKATLNAQVSQPDKETVRITLAHGVEYGVQLELAHEKRYAIVAPTLQSEGPKVVSGLSNLFSKLKI